MSAVDRVNQIRVIDSHTEGEPTRVVVRGGPKLRGDLAEQRDQFAREFDHIRTGVVLEPRGSDAVVGALLTEPVAAGSCCGVIFFNNAGYLGMCGHGTIGLIETLRYLGRVEPGEHRVDTPVGTVTARLNPDHSVSIHNVRSYRFKTDIKLEVPEFGLYRGDVAYGGNWFFLSEPKTPLRTGNLDALTRESLAIKQALQKNAIQGEGGAEIDHIELFGPAERKDANSKNFVLCPGGAYDRSPCGTGLSAKLACLAAAGQLKPGEKWRQESIIGSLFEGSYETVDSGILPSITGTAHVTAQSQLLFDVTDPFRDGIRL